jgi:hypothetical protein
MRDITTAELVNLLRVRAETQNKRGYSGEASEWLELADLIESLQAQLAASQRREKAAVEDINSVRMCHTCKHFLREFGMGGIECEIPCVTIRCENFEWRGSDARKGDCK